MMKTVKSKTYGLLLVGGLALSIVRLVFAFSVKPSEQPSFEWLKTNKNWLILADETLAVAIFLLGIAILLLVVQNIQLFPIRSAIIGVAFLAASWGWMTLTLDLGRMVYPVNGLKSEKALLTMYLSQVYGALHWSDLALGIGTIGLASLKQSRIIWLSGIIVGLLQIIGTYYQVVANSALLVFSSCCWLIWLLIYCARQIQSNLDLSR